ncbi:MAG: class I tRNA ligase family protein, partial [Candidatus Peregrinibacteria bacterium]|nr:class I tRNA ligase family protein [Candidatus Peregrinibacteria bacterium]
FESGSMPYAAIHHPFEGDGKLDETFPADFIAEGIDQTRGWFYTLMVLSTALFDQPAFRNVIVNGIVLAEDGEKMSKSKKNYPDPNEIMERIGADALRFYLLASPAAKGESLKFSEEGVDQVVKKLLLPLRNIHKFFVTYANADEWEPEEGLVGEIHEGTREKPEGELDRWILAKLEEVQTEVTAAFDAYDMPRVTQALVGFIEDLSNWYVRLSRKRFWRSASDADKDSAYKTLFEVLIRYSQMLAPVVPFIAETTYRELTGEDSVHLSNWPKENKGYADPEILKEMAEVRTLVTGGLALRNKERIRVRQPLSEICVVRDGRLPDLEGAFVDLIKAELNVKDLRVIEPDDPEVFIPEIKLEFGVIGRKFREKVKLIQQAISAGDYSLSDGRLAVAGETLVEGTDYTLERKPNENFAVSQEGGYTLALKIHITDELKAEGVARDLIRAVQETRKEADLRVSDRIMLEVSGEGIEGIIREHRATIIGEVLADQLVDHLDDPDLAKDVVIQGYEVRVALKKIVPLESS